MQPLGLPLENNHSAPANCFILLRQGYGGHARSNTTPQGATFTRVLQNATRRVVLAKTGVNRSGLQPEMSDWKSDLRCHRAKGAPFSLNREIYITSHFRKSSSLLLSCANPIKPLII